MRPGRQSLVGIAAVLAAAATLAGVFLWPRAHETRCERLLASGGPTGEGIGPTGPTIASALPPPAKRMTWSAARSAFGVAVPLPNTPAVSASDVGVVWEGTLSQGRSLKVNFPSRDLMIYYSRPAVLTPQSYQGDAAQIPFARFVELNGTTPALVLAENSDSTCGNLGSVSFVKSGTQVIVYGHQPDATLEAIAQSLLARWPV